MRMLSDAAAESVAQSVLFCCRQCTAEFFVALADLVRDWEEDAHIIAELMDSDPPPATWACLCEQIADDLSEQEGEELSAALAVLIVKLREARCEHA